MVAGLDRATGGVMDESAVGFVTGEWLEGRLRDPEVCVIQVGGESYYSRVHLPGARLVVMSQLVGTVDGIPGMRLPVSELVDTLSGLGAAAGTVVAYDAVGGMDAARLIWTLSGLGHRGRRLVLDGGMSRWMQESRPVTLEIPPRPYRSLVAAPQPDDEVDWRGVMAVVEGRRAATLLDTRSRLEYLGGGVGSASGGHLPGAVHVAWTDSLVDGRDPRLKPREALLALYASMGVEDPGREVVVYCQTAHRAAQSWVLLKHLGFSRVRLYDGSMAEWRWLGLPLVAGESGACGL